nr:IS3 family transposase [Tardiphaga sp. vice304]
MRRLAADRDAAVEATRGRERQAEADCGRPFAGQGDAAGRHPPKNLRPVRQRKLVDGICGEWGISIRRACRVFEVDTSTYHYKSRRPEQASLEARIREICQTRVRFGYRRVHVLLRREGWQLGQNKTRRIYRELGLQLRNKTPKRGIKAKLRDDRKAATQPNETWAMDFVHDQLATGNKIRVLTIVDLFSRYVPALDPRFSYRAENVVQKLQEICSVAGYPKTIRCDQGSEFISRDLDLWAYVNGVTLDVSRPGKPTDNAFIEAFNGRFRAECLNTHWFLTLDDARTKLEDWRRYYNEERPHGAIGQKTPISLLNRDGATSPPS